MVFHVNDNGPRPFHAFEIYLECGHCTAIVIIIQIKSCLKTHLIPNFLRRSGDLNYQTPIFKRTFRLSKMRTAIKWQTVSWICNVLQRLLVFRQMWGWTIYLQLCSRLLIGLSDKTAWLYVYLLWLSNNQSAMSTEYVVGTISGQPKLLLFVDNDVLCYNLLFTRRRPR